MNTQFCLASFIFILYLALYFNKKTKKVPIMKKRKKLKIKKDIKIVLPIFLSCSTLTLTLTLALVQFHHHSFTQPFSRIEISLMFEKSTTMCSEKESEI